MLSSTFLHCTDTHLSTDVSHASNNTICIHCGSISSSFYSPSELQTPAHINSLSMNSELWLVANHESKSLLSFVLIFNPSSYCQNIADNVIYLWFVSLSAVCRILIKHRLKVARTAMPSNAMPLFIEGSLHCVWFLKSQGLRKVLTSTSNALTLLNNIEDSLHCAPVFFSSLKGWECWWVCAAVA